MLLSAPSRTLQGSGSGVSQHQTQVEEEAGVVLQPCPRETGRVSSHWSHFVWFVTVCEAGAVIPHLWGPELHPGSQHCLTVLSPVGSEPQPLCCCFICFVFSIPKAPCKSGWSLLLPSSFPFGGKEHCYAFKEAIPESLPVFQALLPSVNASHGIPLSWIQKTLKLALLKSRVFVLLLTFSVLSKTFNSTML